MDLVKKKKMEEGLISDFPDPKNKRIKSEDFAETVFKDEIDYNNPKCLNCNNCCGIATEITKKEKWRISKFLNKVENIEILLKVKEKAVNGFFGDCLDLTCPFTDPETRRCLIYHIRPETCKKYHCKKSLKAGDLQRHLKKCDYVIGDVIGFSRDNYMTVLQASIAQNNGEDISGVKIDIKLKI